MSEWWTVLKVFLDSTDTWIDDILKLATCCFCEDFSESFTCVTETCVDVIHSLRIHFIKKYIPTIRNNAICCHETKIGIQKNTVFFPRLCQNQPELMQ